MSMDLLQRLIADIIAVTEAMMEADHNDIAAAPNYSTPEKKHTTTGHSAKNRHMARRPMSQGVHRSVC